MDSGVKNSAHLVTKVTVQLARSALGRIQPAEAVAGFSPWQPAMLVRTAGFGQELPLAIYG